MESPIYVIVRFELKDGEFEVLFPLIQQFFKKEVSAFPGFISSRIHTNEERSVLINYATWESTERFLKFISELAMVSEISFLFFVIFMAVPDSGSGHLLISFVSKGCRGCP